MGAPSSAEGERKVRERLGSFPGRLRWVPPAHLKAAGPCPPSRPHRRERRLAPRTGGSSRTGRVHFTPRKAHLSVWRAGTSVGLSLRGCQAEPLGSGPRSSREAGPGRLRERTAHLRFAPACAACAERCRGLGEPGAGPRMRAVRRPSVLHGRGVTRLPMPPKGVQEKWLPFKPSVREGYPLSHLIFFEEISVSRRGKACLIRA